MEIEIENDLHKTMKIKNNKNIFVSVRQTVVNKNMTKNYLSPTVSSINKKNSKFDNPTQQNIKYSMNKTTSPIKRSKSNGNILLSRSFSNSDNLNHFTNNPDLGYDIYGHFS